MLVRCDLGVCPKRNTSPESPLPFSGTSRALQRGLEWLVLATRRHFSRLAFLRTPWAIVGNIARFFAADWRRCNADHKTDQRSSALSAAKVFFRPQLTSGSLALLLPLVTEPLFYLSNEKAVHRVTAVNTALFRNGRFRAEPSAGAATIVAATCVGSSTTTSACHSATSPAGAAGRPTRTAAKHTFAQPR